MEQPQKKSKGKAKAGAKSGKGAKQFAKLRGRESDPDDIRISKTLSWILRHGAKSERLYMREDGYVRVKDLIALPRLRSLDFIRLEQIVQQDDKQRFSLLFEPEQSTIPGGTGGDIWWIRANQGHSIESVDLHLAEITDAKQVPLAVHGTYMQSWDSIAKQGLSRMSRQHIHLAQGVPGDGVISGMRKSAQVHIYVDLEKAMRAGIKFYLSDNGVVLTPGNERGVIPPEFFLKVVHANGGPLQGWEINSLESAVPVASEYVPEVTVVTPEG